MGQMNCAHPPILKVFYISGYATDATLRTGVLEVEMAFLQRPFTSDS
jgi:hypothetical protein